MNNSIALFIAAALFACSMLSPVAEPLPLNNRAHRHYNGIRCNDDDDKNNDFHNPVGNSRRANTNFAARQRRRLAPRSLDDFDENDDSDLSDSDLDELDWSNDHRDKHDSPAQAAKLVKRAFDSRTAQGASNDFNTNDSFEEEHDSSRVAANHQVSNSTRAFNRQRQQDSSGDDCDSSDEWGRGCVRPRNFPRRWRMRWPRRNN